MSEDEHVKGKLIYRGECSEQNAEQILRDNVRPFKCIKDSYYDTYTEMLKDTVCDFVVLNECGKDCIYEVIKQNICSSTEVFIANKNKKGYDFEVIYYNGGCGLDEALQEAINGCE